MKPLTQYDEENVNYTIEGYYMRRVGETPISAFERAKAEAIEQLSASLERLKQATPESYFYKQNGGATA